MPLIDPVLVWTIDDDARMSELASLGVGATPARRSHMGPLPRGFGHVRPAEPDEPLVRTWLTDLGDDGLIDPDLLTSIAAAEPEAFTRVWDKLRPLYASPAPNSSIMQVKRATVCHCASSHAISPG